MELTASPPSNTQQLIRGESHILSTSDDIVMMKEIRETHSPDGGEVDVRPLLHVVEEILQRSTATTLEGVVQAPQATMEALEGKIQQAGFILILELLSFVIQKISCEISYKCSVGGHAHATTMTLFNTLSSYPWEAKVVLALAAFAVNYGEFWLVAELYTTHPLAKSVAILKQFPDILEHSDMLKPWFDALKGLIKAMLDLTKCVVQFKGLPAQYITPDTLPMAEAWTHIPTAVYWTIRSVVVCTSLIIGLFGLGHDCIPSTAEAWELSSLAHKLTNIHNHLTNQLTLCNHYIDEERQVQAFQMLVRLFQTIQSDNMKILETLFHAGDDLQPLVDSSSKKRVGTNVLRRKNVLLLISDLDVSDEVLSFLDHLYRESRQLATRPETQFEVVWLPVVDRLISWSEAKQQEFERLQSMMPWYSVYHPSLIKPAVIKYIKEEWHFEKKPILVVLDPQGRVVNPDALHMMWIWGSLAFPFTSTKEAALWKEETWGLNLLVDGVDPLILNWITEERFICLYGGEDTEWIRNFAITAQDVAQAAGITFEIVYVGKSNPMERVQENVATIASERLSHCWPVLTSIWFFWVRLERMWYSKKKQGKTVENDPIMKEILTMLTFDGSEQGWAVISRGSAEMSRAKGDRMLSCLQQYDFWKNNVDQKGFIPALNDHLQQLHTPDHCNGLILPSRARRIPETVICVDCGRPMEWYNMYRCCTD